MASSISCSLLLAILFGAVWSSYGIGYTYPKESINLHVNDTLEIICGLDAITSTENSTNLHFYHDRTLVDSSYVKTLNSSAIQLVIPKMAATTTTTLYSCKLAASEDSCNDKGRCDSIGMNQVYVGYKPQNVTNFKCRSFNLQSMLCTFEKPFNPVYVNYSLTFYLNETNIHSCILTNNSCLITTYSKGGIYRPFKEKYYFTLTAKNALGNLQEYFEIDHFSIVVPNPPSGVSASEITPSSAKLKWKRPYEMQLFEMLFNYSVRYTCEYDNGRWYELDAINENKQNESMSVVLGSLPYPYTEYHVEIRSKVNISKNISEMWSRPANSSFTSSSRIPDDPPLTAPGSFFVDDNYNVFIYWKELEKSRQNGAEFSYHLECTSHKEHNVSSPRDNFMKKYNALKAKDTQDITFTLHSKNKLGLSERSSKIRVPSRGSRCHPPHDIRSILHNDKGPDRKYVFSWQPPTNDANNIVSYTVFWCQAQLVVANPCKSSFDFTTFDSSVLSFEINTTEVLSFAVAANSDTSSSGMVWVKCTAVAGDEFSKISKPTLKDYAPTSVTVEWNTECNDQTLSHGYQITYCLTPSTVVANCIEPVQQINVTGATIHSFSLPELEPYRCYKVQVAAQSDTSTGPLSEPEFFTTLEDTPSPPRSLNILNKTSSTITIAWEAPLKINGIIRYDVHYNTHKKTVNKHDNATDRMVYVLEDHLLPHTLYEIGVVACTGATKCSDTSNLIHPVTDIGEPGKVMVSSTPSITREKVITWKPPTVPGGKLDYYEMAVSREGDVHHMIVYLNSTNCTLDISPCTNGYPLSFKVRAVNLDYAPHATATMTTITENDLNNDRLALIEESNIVKRHSNIDYQSDTRNQLLANNHHNQPSSEHHTTHSICREQLSRIPYKSKYVTHFKGEWVDVNTYLCDNPQEQAMPFLIGVMLLVLVGAMLLSVKYMWKKVERMREFKIVLPQEIQNKLADLPSGKGGIVNGTVDPNRKVDIIRADVNGVQENDVMLPCSSDEGDSVGEGDAIEATTDVRDNGMGFTLHNELGQSPLVSAKQSPLSDYSSKFSFINPATTPVVMPVKTNSPIPYQMVQRPMSTFIPNTPNTAVLDPLPVVRSPMINSNGYVSNDICTMVRSGYLPQEEAFAVRPAFVPSPASTPDDMRAKVPVEAATTDNQGIISGYVTHKDLYDYGQHKTGCSTA